MNTKKEKLLFDTYRSFIDQCLGRIKPDSLNEILSEKAMGFGTTADEKIFGIEDFLKLLSIQKEQSEGLDMNWEIDNLSRYVNSEENLAVFADDLHLTIAVNGEKIKMYLRISIIMEYKNDKWIIIHWHGSKPENVQSEEDTFGIESWKQKVDELEKLVAERTADLVRKNRELEIETSLEKIRAVAMSMMKPDDLLEVSKVQFNELKQLGFTEMRNTLIGIFHDDKNYFTDYDFSDFSGGSSTNIPYNKNALIDRSLQQMKSATDAFTEFIVEGKELEEWKAFRKQNGEYDDSRITDKLYYYFYSISTGNVGLSTFKKISDEQLIILKRFRNVFDLAYQRYTDISLAEAQAREAQIEAALERVRSRSLAMHNTSELQEVIHTVHKELLHLDISIIGGSFIVINSEIENELHCWGSGGTADTTEEIHIPLYKKPFCTNLINRIKKGKGFFTEEYTQKEKKEFFTFLFKHEPWSKLKAKQKKETLESSGGYTRSCMVSQHTSIFIINHFGEKFSADDNDILKRFGKVFEQSYTRFLDLQKAEAQTREAEIELALERVRAKTMAMQKSEELAETSFVLFEQLKKLGETSDQISIGIFNETDNSMDLYSTVNGLQWKEAAKIDLDEPVVLNKIYVAWKAQKKSLVIDLTGKELQKYNAYRKKLSNQDFKENRWVIHTVFFSKGVITFSTTEPHDTMQLLERFAGVFDGTYTRFLDLQKAEAQAREAEIELALERVRARTMAMQHSDELADASLLLDQQIRGLGIKTRGCAFNIYGEKESTEWFSNEMGTMHTYKTPREKVFLDYYDAGQKGETLLIKEFSGKECVDWYNYLCTLPVIGDGLKEMIANGGSFPTRQIDHVSFFKYGYLLFLTFEPVPEFHEIFKRFAKVFEQTYTRFLDLQKAEAQAREAQIEASLERVRSRTMGMQKSDELKEVIQVVYDQFIHLNINVEHTGFILDYKLRDDMHIWLADRNNIQNEIIFPYFDSPHWNSFIKAKKNGSDFFANQLNFEQKNKFYLDLFKLIGELPQEVKDYYFSCEGLAISTVLIDNVGLYIENFKGIPYSREENDILMRFGKVFQQTYTRFLDLQKAEEQTREAQIEAALEKVRSVALGLKKSEDMLEVAQALYEQLILLGFTNIRNSIIDIDNEDGETFLDYDYSHEMGGTVTPMSYKDDPTLKEQLKDIITTTDGYSETILKGKQLQDLINMRRKNGEKEDPRLLKADNVSYILFAFGNGAIGVSNFGTLSEKQKAILSRFRNVFTFAYKRYSDLTKAEYQAREAQIETGLEKVRSRTLAMQKSDELADTSIVIFEQLINLGIEPNRLFIGIINKETAAIEAWATNEDGTKIGNHFTLNTDKNKSVKKMYDGWKEKKSSITIDMTGEELHNYFHYLSDEMHIPFKGGLSQKRRIQTIAYFGQGLIGMASPDEQPEATTQLLERFAAVFNLTYTRFNDLKIAEAHAIQAEEDLVKLQIEKRRAEEALTNLKAAQSQLVQSEKMASLGELPAGIAHEIQNPLNFVNNFSEVSQELLDEMKEEMDKGNLDDVKEIMNDVIQNLEKINHHGKRADAIVKGMLQHSRSSTGVKEPTDINALADEYLRLSYHGLRAKDKSFNAEMKTDFDESIGKINIIPQDIGRVVLNLINNAFYAVDEKKKSGIVDYQPTVSISTKKLNEKVEIRISDNGNGIPQNIVDKIFQPFFTTKPTGQGTGLGLSLSYDIVKAHGGEISIGSRGKVESKEGEGSTFIIVLPVIS